MLDYADGAILMTIDLAAAPFQASHIISQTVQQLLTPGLLQVVVLVLDGADCASGPQFNVPVQVLARPLPCQSSALCSMSCRCSVEPGLSLKLTDPGLHETVLKLSCGCSGWQRWWQAPLLPVAYFLMLLKANPSKPCRTSGWQRWWQRRAGPA